MAKYEIMLLISSNLKEAEANKIASDLIKTINEKNIKETKIGLKDMAYEIKKMKKAYYFQYNFESDQTENLEEFKRLTRINKNVLRQLVINIEKDYGYKASVNPKKVASNKKAAEVNAKKREEARIRSEQRKAEYEARKAEWAAKNSEAKA